MGFPLGVHSTATRFPRTVPSLEGQRQAQADIYTKMNNLKDAKKDPCPEIALSSGITLLKPPPPQVHFPRVHGVFANASPPERASMRRSDHWAEQEHAIKRGS